MSALVCTGRQVDYAASNIKRLHSSYCSSCMLCDIVSLEFDRVCLQLSAIEVMYPLLCA